MTKKCLIHEITALFFAASMALIPASCSTSHVAGKQSTPAARIEAAVAVSANVAGKAAVARDIAINAIRNATATCSEKQQNLLDTLKTGNKDKIEQQRESLKDVISDLENALDTAQKIIERADKAIAYHATARDMATAVSKSASEKELQKAARETERLAADADNTVKDAETLAETLKQKWLIPPPPAIAVPSAPPATPRQNNATPPPAPKRP